MSGMRVIYDEDKVSVTANPSVTAFEGASVTATTFLQPGGLSFTITIPATLTSTSAMQVQVNNLNPLITQFHQTPGLNQDLINPSFTAGWTSLGIIPAVASTTAFANAPYRWVRINGLGTTGAFEAFFWTDQYVRGGN